MVELPEITSEHPHHECGVVGIFSPNNNVSHDLYFSLIALQNRGQANSGMAVFDDNGKLLLHKGRGLVYSVFNEENIAGLVGSIGVGHNRYGTTGIDSKENGQPFMVDSDLGVFAFGHNGNIFNAPDLKNDLVAQGETFESTSDSEVLAKLIARSPGRTFVEKIRTAIPKLKGAYSFVIATKDSLIGTRDPRGFWPLSLGRINGSGYILASETNAIDRIGGKFIKDIENGEVVVIDREGVSSDNIGRERESLCSFEFFYFSDPYSRLLETSVELSRIKMGRLLAREHHVDADIVVSIPETADPLALGYSLESGIPLSRAILRNRWLGRTFIDPSPRMREEKAKSKYGVIPEIVNGQRVVVVDDSIVRGLTTGKTLNLFWEAGAREVHSRISAPPIIRECYWGVDTADQSELIAANHTLEETRDRIRATSLGYLSLEAGMRAIGHELRNRFCVSCFTGEYLMEVPNRRNRFALDVASR